MGGVIPSTLECGCQFISGHPYSRCAQHSSLWDLYKRFEGIDPATPLPTMLDARRKHDDGLTHCTRCGGTAFTGTLRIADDGQPAQLLTPQTCVGCGELRKASWP